MKQALIVEDDDVIRETLKMLLEDEDFHIVSYADGIHAIGYLRQQSDPHVVLTDYLMPRMMGSEFLHEALDELHLVQHRYIMLAARPRSLLAPEANALIDRWHVTYIQKPFEIDTLWGAINDNEADEE